MCIRDRSWGVCVFTRIYGTCSLTLTRSDALGMTWNKYWQLKQAKTGEGRLTDQNVIILCSEYRNDSELTKWQNLKNKLRRLPRITEIINWTCPSKRSETEFEKNNRDSIGFRGQSDRSKADHIYPALEKSTQAAGYSCLLYTSTKRAKAAADPID